MADGLISLSAAIGTLGLIVEVAVILVDVIGRAAGAPLYGSQDMITMTMVVLVFGGMALCDRNGGHIAVDLFERFYSPRLNWVIDIVAALLGAIIFAAMAYAVYVKWSQESGQLAKVYPKPMKGYENGEAPEFYRSV